MTRNEFETREHDEDPRRAPFEFERGLQWLPEELGLADRGDRAVQAPFKSLRQLASVVIEPRTVAETRLRQMTRLCDLQRRHGEEFNALGLSLTRRAIFSMMRDCQAGGIGRERLMAVLGALGAGATANATDATPS